jgi:hypothetical protein
MDVKLVLLFNWKKNKLQTLETEGSEKNGYLGK